MSEEVSLSIVKEIHTAVRKAAYKTHGVRTVRFDTANPVRKVQGERNSYYLYTNKPYGCWLVKTEGEMLVAEMLDSGCSS